MLAERITIIHNDAEYEKALDELERLIELKVRNQNDVDDIELLSILIEKYEEENYSMKIPKAKDAIKFMMEQNNLSNKDLAPYFGSASRVSEYFNNKRRLTLKTIKALHERFGISYEALMNDT